jgi:choline kinase
VVTRHAVILAAGVGSRLWPLTATWPKALVPVGGRPVIARTLDALATHGIESATVVVGYAHDRISEYLADRDDLRITYVENPAYATTNTIASVACAGRVVNGSFLLIDGDLVFESGILGAVLTNGTWLAVDRSRPLDEDAIKVCAVGTRITRVGKVMPAGAAPEAESIGLAHIERETARALFPLCDALVRTGNTQAYYEAAFQDLIDQGHVFNLADITGSRWVEIDDHDDLRRAESLFFDP